MPTTGARLSQGIRATKVVAEQRGVAESIAGIKEIEELIEGADSIIAVQQHRSIVVVRNLGGCGALRYILPAGDCLILLCQGALLGKGMEKDKWRV